MKTERGCVTFELMAPALRWIAIARFGRGETGSFVHGRFLFLFLRHSRRGQQPPFSLCRRHRQHRFQLVNRKRRRQDLRTHTQIPFDFDVHAVPEHPQMLSDQFEPAVRYASFPFPFAAALQADGPTLIAIPIARQERALVPPVE
jgi:hypothetical protein